MKRFFALVVLCAAANVAFAEVITLKCDGTNASGENFTDIVQFSPNLGWAKLESSPIKLTGAVSANFINVFLGQMMINRQTGEFTKGQGEKMFKGNCIKNDTKF